MRCTPRTIAGARTRNSSRTVRRTTAGSLRLAADAAPTRTRRRQERKRTGRGAGAAVAGNDPADLLAAEADPGGRAYADRLVASVMPPVPPSPVKYRRVRVSPFFRATLVEHGSARHSGSAKFLIF